MIKFLYAKAPGKSNFVKINVGNYSDETQYTYIDYFRNIYIGSSEYEDEEGEIVTETTSEKWCNCREVRQLVKQGENVPNNMEDFASDLANVFIKCYGITSIEEMKTYDCKSVNIYELNKESTKTNMKLTLLWPRSTWNAPGGGAIFVFGDYLRGIYTMFLSDYGNNYNKDFPHDPENYTNKCRLVMNPKYKNANNLSQLLKLMRKEEQSFLSTNSLKAMNMVDEAPFYIANCTAETIYNVQGATGKLMQCTIGSNTSPSINDTSLLSYQQRFMCNLNVWNNWYTMIKGKHFYGTPNRFKLKTPITDTDGTKISYFELTSPITMNGYSSVFNRDWTNTKEDKIMNPYWGITPYDDYLPLRLGLDTINSNLPQPYMSNSYRYYDCGHDFDAICYITGYKTTQLIFDNDFSIKYANQYKREFVISDKDDSNWISFGGAHQDSFGENQSSSTVSQYVGRYLLQPRSFAAMDKGFDAIVDRNIKNSKWSEMFPIMMAKTVFRYSPIKEINYEMSGNGDSNYITNLTTRWLFNTSESPTSYEFREGYLYNNITSKTFWDDLFSAYEVNDKEFVKPDPLPDNSNPGGYSPGANGSIGGNGAYNPDNNVIVGSEKPKIEITSLGTLFRNYVVSINTLSQLGTWMNSFTSVIPEGTNPSDTALVIEQATKYAQFNDKASAIVSLKVIYTPTALPTSGAQNITVNSEDTGLSSPVLSSQYIKGTMGAYRFNRYYDSFLDYSPYTTIELYLPFYGMLRLEPESFMDDTLTVNYTIDVLTGILTYEIMNSKNGVLYTAEGNCSYEVPLTATDYSGKISALQNLYNIRNRTTLEGLTTALGAITSGANGNLGGAVSSITSITNRAMDANEAAINYQHTKIPVSRTGNISGSAGLGTPLYPYVIIKRARMAMPATMGSEMGFRSNISATLGSLSGFTKVQNIKLSNMGIATAEEISMVKEQLMNGVII